MRLLPRTPRGTWLLAAAVWLAGCRAFWLALPVRPRAIASDPNIAEVLQFSADGRALLTRAYVKPPRTVNDSTDGPYRVWDTTTGRCLGEWLPAGPGPSPKLASDGRSAVLMIPGDDDLLDVRTGRREHLPRPVHGPACFTADGRYLAYPTWRIDPTTLAEAYDTVWWDRRAGRVANTVTGARMVAMAADGRWVSVREPPGGGGPVTASVREPVTGRELGRFRRDRPFWDPVAFSPGGDHLVVADDTGVSVIEIPDGRECLRLPHGSAVLWPPGTSEVFTVRQSVTVQHQHIPTDPQAEDTVWLSRWDLSSGQCLGCRRDDIPDRTFREVLGMPTRGLVLVHTFGPPPDRLDEWLASLPVLGRVINAQSSQGVLLDARTGSVRARFPLPDEFSLRTSPDGHTLLVLTRGGRLEFWDLPPRKPLSWLIAAAVVWALPLAWLARRRARKLASGVA
jgi:hypothetical protein